MTAWGVSWGASWGNSWGAATVVVPAGVFPPSGDGTDYRRRKLNPNSDLDRRIHDERRRRHEEEKRQAVAKAFGEAAVELSDELGQLPTVDDAVDIARTEADTATALAAAHLAVLERKKAIDLETLRKRRAVAKAQMQEIYAQQLVERAKQHDDEDTLLALLLAA